MKILHRLLGYCPICGRWFQFSTKKRKQNTAYVEDEKNYIVCCKSCFEDVEAYWDERWKELYEDQMLGLRMMK